MLGNRDDFLNAAAKAAPVKIVDVPGLGQVGLCVMTGTQREQWEAQAFRDGKFILEGFRARLLAKTICDESGIRLFDDKDIDLISSFPAPALVKLFAEAQKLNALTPDDIDELTKK